MEYLHKCFREKKSIALSNQKQIEKLDTVNTSIEEETLYGLQTKDHSLQPGSTERKRVSSVIEENTQCKCIKIADEIKQKHICTVSKNEESLLGKINLVIGERIDILNYFFNQKTESLNRRVEEVQCKKSHEETAILFLKKLSKLERRIKAAKAFQEEVFSKMAVHQTMLPSVYYPNTAVNQLGPSAFCPNITNIPTNTFLLSPYTGFPSTHVSEYTSSDGLLLFPVETQNSAIANNLAIPTNQMYTQAEMSAAVQAEQIGAYKYLSNHQNSKPVCINQGFLKLREETSNKTFKQFPHPAPLPRFLLCPELTKEFQDPSRNLETRSGLFAKPNGYSAYRN